MPAKTPEAIARKKQRKNEKNRAEAPKRRALIQKSDLPRYKITARRMMPRLPDNISKADLRAMLAEAVRNTVST